jgi:hypothetical protein
MSDKLAEALDAIERAYMDQKVPPAVLVIPTVDAARRWASFPTDDDVKAATYEIAVAIQQGYDWQVAARAALEAVKREEP